MSRFRPGRSQDATNAATNHKPVYMDILSDHAQQMGFTYVGNWLSERNVTTLRVIPSLDPETGELDIVLNPDAVPGMDFCDVVGPTVYMQEVCKDVGGAIRCTMLSGSRKTADGSFISDGWSASRIVLNRLAYKLRDLSVLRKVEGYNIDCPRSWLSWDPERACNAPVSWLFVQCLVWEDNGTIVTDPTGDQVYKGPCVFAIPASARKSFVQEITTPVDPRAPLSIDNNLYGDFCSPDGGHMLVLNKLVSNSRGEARTDYILSKLGVAPLHPDYIKGVWQPWENILKMPETVEEELANLAMAFDWQAVDYGLRDTTGERYYDCIPDEWKGCSTAISNGLQKDEFEALAASARGQGTASAPVRGYKQPMPQAPAPANAPAAPRFRPATQQAPVQQAPVQQAPVQQAPAPAPAQPQRQQAPAPAQPQRQQAPAPAQPQRQQAPVPQPQRQQAPAPQPQRQQAPTDQTRPGHLPKAPVPRRQAPPHATPAQNVQDDVPADFKPMPGYETQNGLQEGHSGTAMMQGVEASPDNPDIFAEALRNMTKLRG